MGAAEWGSREEFLHPRDSKGRFRKSWRMADSVIDKLTSLLDSFNAKTFVSDEEASNYVHGRARANRYLTNQGAAIERFLRNYKPINDDLEAGRPNADAAVIKKGMQPLPDDLLLTRNLTPEQLGLTPETIGQAEELTGKLVSSKGFSSTNIGTPLAHQPGTITMAIVTPKGTKAVIPRTSRPTREVILDTDQPYRITKVDSDGQGGFFVYAVASGDSENEKSVDIAKAVPGAGVSEQVAEVPGGTQTGAGDLGIPPKRGPGRPAGPGPGERNDGHVGIVGQGAGGQEEVGTEGVVPEIPKIPETGTDTRATFREAFEQAELKIPTVGERRKQFNDAYLGIASGKKTPQEAVKDLDNAITINKRILASDEEDGTDSGPLPEDIKRQEALSDLIKEHFNFTGRKDFKAAETEVPAKKTAAKKQNIGGDLKRLDQEEGARNRRTRLAAKKAVKAAGPKKVAAKKAVAKTSGDDIDGMTIPQLREEAKKRGIRIPSATRRKDDIKALLRGEKKETEAKVPAKKVAKAAAKKVTPKKAVEVTETKTEEPPKKPTWGTLKSQGFKDGDIVMWHGQDRRNPKTEGRRVRIRFDPSGYALVDPDTGERVHAAGFAHRSWFTPDVGAPKKTAAKKVAGGRIPRGKVSSPERREEIASELEALRERLSKNPEAIKPDLGIPPLTDVIGGWVTQVRSGDMSEQDLDQLLGRLGAVRYGSSRDENIRKISRELLDTAGRLRGEKVAEKKIIPGTKKPAEKGLLFMTVPQLRQKAKDENIKIPTSLRLKKDIVDWLADALVAKERGEEGPSVPKKPKTEFQQKVEENRRIREQEAKERRIAKASRMQLAGERREQRARELKARQEQREAARTEREAQREQERLRKAQERIEAQERKRRDAEEKKAADAKRREEEKRAQELEKVDDYDTLSGPGWTITMLREHARHEGIKIPNDLRFRSEIRDYILLARKNQRAERMAQAKTRLELFETGQAEGIVFPVGSNSWSAEQIARWIEENRELLAEMGIDRKQFKPKGILQAVKIGKLSEQDWDQMAPRNTDPNHPLQVRNLNIENEYVVKYGTLVRRNGISYLIETDSAREAANPYYIARIVKEIEEIHKGLPSGSKYQWDYRWVRRGNPDDPYWAERYKTPRFKSLATAGGGRVTFWRRQAVSRPSHHTSSFRHEYGHNVDGYGGDEYTRHVVSSSPRWADAAVSDSSHVQALRFIPDPRAVSYPIEFQVQANKAWPWGVTDYGKNSHGEDFAESVSLYMSQHILGFDSSGGSTKEMRFRDLYPARARILDQLFPETAKKQKDGSYYN